MYLSQFVDPQDFKTLIHLLTIISNKQGIPYQVVNLYGTTPGGKTSLLKLIEI